MTSKTIHDSSTPGDYIDVEWHDQYSTNVRLTAVQSEDGELGYVSADRAVIELSPGAAVDLASLLLQFATQTRARLGAQT